MFKHKNKVRILNIRTSLSKSIFDALFAILCTPYVISKPSFGYNLITKLILLDALKVHILVLLLSVTNINQ